MSASLSQSLRELLGGLNFLVADGCLHLNRPTPLGPLATKTLRGLAGHALYREAPQLASLFKTFDDRPPAYSFSPRFAGRETSSRLLFRLVTWDRNGQLGPALAAALQSCRGAAFGKPADRVGVVDCQFDPLERALFRPEDLPPLTVTVHLVTPLQVRTRVDPRAVPKPAPDAARRRRAEWILKARELTFGHFCRAAAIRLNNLSRIYGNGASLDLDEILAAAALVPEIRRRLRDETASRFSTSQGQEIRMDGVTGDWTLGPVPSRLFELLQAAGLVQVGGQTTAGCGCIAVCEAGG